MDFLSVDFETRSQCDLFKEGVYRYATDSTTEVLMMGWAFNEEPAVVWTPEHPFPQRVIDHVKAGGEIRAWNAQFERLIWWYVLAPDFGVPEPDLEQFRCTAARARAHGLPGSLKDAARALELPMQKQEAGQRLIKLYCVAGHQDYIPAPDWALFIDYCRMDVEVERQISQCLRDLTDSEWQDYWANERINDRGVPVDVNFAIAAQAYGVDIKAEADRRIAELTKGEVANARARSDRNRWLAARLTDKHLAVLSENSVLKFGKPRREELLLQPDLHAEVREFTELVDEAGGATLGKYQAFADRALDGRLCGAFMFSGGGQTGRYSSTGIQLHNLRRDVFDEPEQMIQTILKGQPVEQPTKALSRLVRAVISHPKGLTWVDYSNIEGRMAPWLEGTQLGEDKLDMFRKGLDPYKVNAAETFSVEYEQVTKEQRQAGKVQELALQFGGGVGALQAMGGNFGLEISDDYGKTLRDGWRKVNPWMAAFGRKLETAVRKCLKAPEVWHEAGRVSYAYDKTDWLWCKLPSGRLLGYHNPQFEDVTTPWGEQVTAVTALWGGGRPKTGESWPRRPLIAGLLIENCTQAASACLLRDALRKCDEQGIEVVMHVHDEIVAQNVDKERLRGILLDAPAWAAGLPIQASAETGVRYGK